MPILLRAHNLQRQSLGLLPYLQDDNGASKFSQQFRRRAPQHPAALRLQKRQPPSVQQAPGLPPASPEEVPKRLPAVQAKIPQHHQHALPAASLRPHLLQKLPEQDVVQVNDPLFAVQLHDLQRTEETPHKLRTGGGPGLFLQEAAVQGAQFRNYGLLQH